MGFLDDLNRLAGKLLDTLDHKNENIVKNYDARADEIERKYDMGQISIEEYERQLMALNNSTLKAAKYLDERNKNK